MQRISTEEILDFDSCPAEEAAISLGDLCRINRWFGGVATTRQLIEQVAETSGLRHFSVLEVGSGFGEVPKMAAQRLKPRGITLEITLLDRLRSHLLPGNHSVVADALELPFPDQSFDLVSSSLFAHHLEPGELTRFASEAMRVSRCALLINDLIRHPLHLALVYLGFALMRSRVSRFDGVASVRRAYTTEEIREILSHCPAKTLEVSRHYLFRMGVIAWKNPKSRPEVYFE